MSRAFFKTFHAFTEEEVSRTTDVQVAIWTATSHAKFAWSQVGIKLTVVVVGGLVITRP